MELDTEINILDSGPKHKTANKPSNSHAKRKHTIKLLNSPKHNQNVLDSS